MLAKLPNRGLAEGDTRAIAKMRAKIESFPGNLEHAPNTMAPVANCNDIARKDLDFGPLRNALYACFDKIGNRLESKERGSPAYRPWICWRVSKSQRDAKVCL